MVKRLNLARLYIYLLLFLDFLLVIYMLLHEIPFKLSNQNSLTSGFLREIFHDRTTLNQKMVIMFTLGAIYILVGLILIGTTVLVVKNDMMLRRGNIIIENIFKGFGHFFIIINYVLLIPSLIIFAEIIRCFSDNSKPTVYFTCLDAKHTPALAFSIISAVFCLAIAIFTNLFVNSQFPNDRVPQSSWNPKSRVINLIWKFIYVYHYDMLDERYRIALRIACLLILIYQFMLLTEQPRAYNKIVNWLDLTFFTVTLILQVLIVLQDTLSEDVLFEHLPILIIFSIIMSGILITHQARRNKIALSKDNRQHSSFETETDMELYISLLFLELEKLKNPEKGIEHSSTASIFTIISRHMEHCRMEECICKKYEPEYDKKFSSIGSRRLTMRQSTSFSSIDFMFKKKIPIKISYETKVEIFMAEIADCIDRFLVTHPKSVGIKLQKSFYYHNYVNSSYKALFVQLENSHSCSSFRGKIGIYHLKTQIQEEMIQSEASPFSMDITTCLKFEAKRVLFEEKIIELCQICESFWNELAQQQSDYNVEKLHLLVLKISKNIMFIKLIYGQLCAYNPQNVDVIQNYALIYRYILRDEFRFNDIINNLNQLKKTNKLEQIRELVPKFFDSDNYAMIIASGDIKDLGRMIKANRGVENIFGYMPNELLGFKINKVMPRLFAQVHDEFIQNFLRKGHSSFIDKNQFLLIENKMHFIQMTLAYIKPLVDLKVGLMFISFFKLPLKVPNNSEGNQYIKAKEAHYILCDSKGQIFGMSHNCMKNLGIPPTIVSKTKTISSMADGSNLTQIDQFSPNILGPEYEFDLPKGMNFTFDTTVFKTDKYLAKEFHELTGRMRKYNIFVSMKKHEYRLSQTNTHEILLFTIEILSFQLSEAPITIPVDKTDDPSYSQYTGTTVSSANSDELRTSKFKEFKTQVQELTAPSKIITLRRITIGFFLFLLGIFSLNYALCAAQNQSYIDRIDVLDLLFELTEKLPTTARYVRTCVNIANGFENNTNEVLSNRFGYYMSEIAVNAQIFNDLQKNIYTMYQSSLSLDSVYVMTNNLQSDFTIKNVSQSISSALNVFASKSLRFSQLKMSDLGGVVIPYLSFDFNSSVTSKGLTDLQQDLYFLIKNGDESISGLLKLGENSQNTMDDQSYTLMITSLVIGIVSIFVNFLIVPFVYPLLVHYERLAYYILHSINKLTLKFVDNEIKCCSLLFNYIGKKQGSILSDKPTAAIMKKPDARKENKQLMKINPKIPKHVLDQERKKKRGARRGRSRMSQMEEEKIMIEGPDGDERSKVRDEDEGSGLLDEELDEDQNTRGMRSQGRSNGQNSHGRQRTNRSRGRRSNYGMGTLEPNTASVASLDESTIQTSIDVNSSTNKSSGDTSSDDDNSSEQGEGESSSQSNYTHYTNVSHWKILKQNGYSNAGNIGLKSNASFIYDMTHAKSSELPAGDTYQERDNHEQLSEEEKEFKKAIKEKQRKIKAYLKKRKLKKVIYLVILIIVISIYLGVNTMYTSFVFSYEDHLQTDINKIDNRILCYPQLITLLKEMVSRNHTVSEWDEFEFNPATQSSFLIKRAQIIKCLQREQEFTNMLLGTVTVNGEAVLSGKYTEISDSLEKGRLCETMYLTHHTPNATKYQLCLNSYNGISQLGLGELLNWVLREGDKTLISFNYPFTTRTTLTNILKYSLLEEVETLQDIFISETLEYQRAEMISNIRNYAANLFRLFDVLFGVFFTFCSITVIFGVMILIRRLRRLIINIYHIVLLIPYGERTKRELNELLKIDRSFGDSKADDQRLFTSAALVSKVFILYFKLHRNPNDLTTFNEEIFNQTNDSQRLQLMQDIDLLMKHQFDAQPPFGSHKPALQSHRLSKNDVVIYNSNNSNDVGPLWLQGGGMGVQNGANSLNQCNHFPVIFIASLFNDSKFVPNDQNFLPAITLGNVPAEEMHILGENFTLGAGNRDTMLPSNSVQLSLDQFKLGNIHAQHNLDLLASQNLSNTQPISGADLAATGVLPSNFLEQIQSANSTQHLLSQQPNQLQSQLMQQYEQVMQLMHQEIQSLLAKNRDLEETIRHQADQQRESLGFRDQSAILDIVIKEKDELIETLRQREQVIMALRVDIDVLNQNMADFQHNLTSQQQFKNQTEQQLKQRNDQLIEKARKLEKESRLLEQHNFELEQQNRQLQRDLKNQTIINDQMRQETIEINTKREQGDIILQETKNKLCQNIIQTRQLQAMVDQQSLQITNLKNINTQKEKFLENANYESENLKEQLSEADSVKIEYFGIIERKEREIQHLRSLVRKFAGLIETHKEEFGGLIDVNYDQLFKDVSNTNVSYQAPNLPTSHLNSVKFRSPDSSFPPAIKTNPNQFDSENVDYYGMVDKLTKYVRDKGHPSNTSLNYGSGQSSNRAKSSGRSEYDNLNSSNVHNQSQHYPQPKSILKNSNGFQQQHQSISHQSIDDSHQHSRSYTSSQNRGKLDQEGSYLKFQPNTNPQAAINQAAAQPQATISWLNGGANPQKQQAAAPQRGKGKSPDRKPNIENLKNTLSSLIEEKATLERQLRSGNAPKSSEDLRFEIDLAANNIKRIQEKIQAASQL